MGFVSNTRHVGPSIIPNPLDLQFLSSDPQGGRPCAHENEVVKRCRRRSTINALSKDQLIDIPYVPLE